MKSSLPAPTKVQAHRMEIISRDIGCIANHILLNPGVPAQVHHLISEKTGRRISHDATIPLSPEFHTGPFSIHGSKRKFAERFGSDEYLLSEVNRLVEIFEANTVGRS